MSQFSNLSYGQVRLAWCRMALVNLIRRWGIYVLVGLLVLGGAGSSAVAAMTAFAAWSVLPLFQSALQPIGQAFLMTFGYALVGGMVVWGLSPVLWSRGWAEAERALPIVEREQRMSDLIIVLLGLTPLFAVYFAGATIWLVKAPAWFQPVQSWALGMLFTSMILSIVFGVAIVGWRRGLAANSPPAGSGRRGHRHAVSTSSQQQILSSAMALVAIPLWRGPAQRSGRFFLLSLLALLSCVASLMVWPLLAPWWLAAFATLAQVLISRLNVLVSTELGPLHDASAALPVNGIWLQTARHAVAIAPLLIGQTVLLMALAYSPVAISPMVWAAYLVALPLGNIALVAASSARPRMQRSADDAARVSWWLLMLVLSLALASEVVV